MGSSLNRAAVAAEVNTSHHGADSRDEAVNKLHRVPMAMAKARVGAAIAEAIGDSKREAYGHAGLLSAVCSGEKVPEYLARIYDDTDARRRLGLELLKGTGVTVRTVVEWEEKVG